MSLLQSFQGVGVFEFSGRCPELSHFVALRLKAFLANYFPTRSQLKLNAVHQLAALGAAPSRFVWLFFWLFVAADKFEGIVLGG